MGLSSDKVKIGHGKSSFIICKSTIDGVFSIATNQISRGYWIHVPWAKVGLDGFDSHYEMTITRYYVLKLAHMVILWKI